MDGGGIGSVDLLWPYYPLLPCEVCSECPPSWEGPNTWQSLPACLCLGQGAAGSQGLSALIVPSTYSCISHTHRKPVSHHAAFLVSFKLL